jgi:Na+-driven multidrug efflux pump
MGAGLATSLARFVEAGIIIIWAHAHKKKFTFMEGLYRTFHIPATLVKDIIKTGTPLLLNEAMWSGGMAFLSQCYSLRGLNVVAGFNITTTMFNLVNVAIIATGTAISIIVGQLLGASKIDEARDKDNKLIGFAIMLSVGIALFVAVISPFFPQLYDTTAEAQGIATRLMLLQALFFPSFAFMNSAYFTMRSGGKTFITFLFDSVFVWAVSVPIAFCCSRFTDMSVYMIFVCVNLADFIKCIIGGIMLKKGLWIQNIVDEK